MARKSYREDDIVIDVAADQASMTLGALLDHKGYPRKSMKGLFDDKLVLLNGHKTNPKAVLASGDQIRLQMPKEKLDYDPIPMELTMVYEDHDILVIDKPVGITVNSQGQVSLANGIASYFKNQGIKRKVRFLNRLDRDTSGCVVIAKSGLAQSIYQGQMDHHNFRKFYRAQVQGDLQKADLSPDQEDIEATDICNVLTQICKTVYSLTFPMGRAADGIHQEVRVDGKKTRTDFEILAYDPVKDQTQVEVELFTGRTHQIRLAFAHLGYPLVGDILYGAKPTGKPFSLRAHKIIFKHMRDGHKVTLDV